jgi:fluoride exporter
VANDLGSTGAEPGSSAQFHRDTHSPQRESKVRINRAQLVIVIALGCGGVVGAVARYAVSLALPIASGSFPWNTFLINVSGSAVLGFLLVLLIEQFPRGRLVRPFIGTGIIGAYTTFSTLEVDAILLFRVHHLLVGASYVMLSVIAGLMAVWLGMLSARLVIRAEQWLQGEMS